MQRDSRKGFVLSLLLHVGAVGGAIVLSLVQAPQQPSAMVFELFDGPPGGSSGGLAGPGGGEDGGEETIEFNVPTSPQPRPQRRVQPAPPKQTKPPVPAPPDQRKAVPKSPPRQTGPALSYEEFVRLHGPPRATAPRAPSAGAGKGTGSGQRIDTRFDSGAGSGIFDGDSIGTGGTVGGSGGGGSVVGGYIGRMKAALKRVWDKPANLAHSVAAVVEFDVAANGRLSRAAVVKSSGVPQFDQSVLDSFVTLGTAGATPDGRPMRVRLTFQMTEQ